ncbi:hypothetical protein QAD02_020623 [Eretmocerus hayati]|uniref:Uncharacterized protein n=1 Tax=Eretmocerus hayati TaxID=131215 RepID=A0ACC2PN20_9HYME|nr:hypothetical protein QAD02_020623 [Eretmocerus hayati]
MLPSFADLMSTGMLYTSRDEFHAGKLKENSSATLGEFHTIRRSNVRIFTARLQNYIECKQTDAKSREEKNRGWENLVEAFNSITTGIPRTEKNLRNLWDKLKKKARKADKTHKKETVKTVAEFWDKIWICEISTCSRFCYLALTRIVWFIHALDEV